jgi:hypothetical protein
LEDISISSSTEGRVFFEGSLGEIQEIQYVNGSVIEFKGTHGTICIGIEKSRYSMLVSGGF